MRAVAAVYNGGGFEGDSSGRRCQALKPKCLAPGRSFLMKQAWFRFYAELNDFLPADRRQRAFAHSFAGRVAVKDMIEALGVPHTEVELILVNGASVDFTYLVQEGDRVSVYPVFERLNIAGVTRLRPRPLRVPRFIADVHLGALVKKLRLLGFDTLYDPGYDDPELAALSSTETRILLTRDTGLLMRSVVSRGLYIRNTDPRLQLKELITRLDLGTLVKPFTRCIRCNGTIAPVPAGTEAYRDVLRTVPPGVRSWCRDFGACTCCGNVYWKGSHFKRILEELSDLLPDIVDAYPDDPPG